MGTFAAGLLIAIVAVTVELLDRDCDMKEVKSSEE
jgi:hypothetical protein